MTTAGDRRRPWAERSEGAMSQRTNGVPVFDVDLNVDDTAAA